MTWKGRARGKKPGPRRKMNGLERFYAEELERRRLAGEILSWQFEGIRLKLAEGSWYKPDFFVVTREGYFEIHETKGRWQEAARVRIRVAAERYPFFHFVAIKADSRGGLEEEIFDPFERSE